MLTIGTDSYKNDFSGELNDLENAGHDALTAGDRFAELGFSVRYVLDPTRNKVLAEVAALVNAMRQLEELPNVRPRDARAVVYVAGHGMSFQLDNEILDDFLVFRPDSELGRQLEKTFEAASLDTNALRRNFQDFKDFDILFVLDACRSLKRLDKTVDGRLRNAEGRTFSSDIFDAGSSQLITAFSTSENEVAADSSSVERRGLYVSVWERVLGVRGLTPHEIIEITRFFVTREDKFPVRSVSPPINISFRGVRQIPNAR